MFASARLIRALTLLLLALPAACSTGVDERRPSSVVLGAGMYIPNQPDAPAAIRGQYVHEPVLWEIVRPFGGLDIGSGGSLCGYGGISADIRFLEDLFLTPGFAVGYYMANGGKDLGQPLEFRSSVELTYGFDGGYRLGLSYDHVSNAGMKRLNPGQDTIMVVFHLPLDSSGGE
jgi:lipid A 3-O-deacylase